MPLEPYRKKRSFRRSPEPAGELTGGVSNDAGAVLRFVVQKHQARQLHYDFRLEHQGVLKSWAVPKGPSLDPSQKRLAVEVEDHPLEYGDFEGQIPEGEYGAGTVLVWDHGTWICEGDVAQSLKAGMVKFELRGQKLRGRWMLVRLKPKEGEKQVPWLLVKERDAEARRSSQYDVLASLPKSVLSGHTLLEVNSHVPPKNRKRMFSSWAEEPADAGIELPNARRTAIPTKMDPQLASSVGTAPRGEQWLHEIKWDGYRLIAYRENDWVVLRTRGHQDWTRRLPHLADAVRQLPLRSAILDGELVAQNRDGTSSFQSLQSAFRRDESASLIYQVFDLLYLDGYDLRRTPLALRKERLAECLRAARSGAVQYLDHVRGHGDVFAEKCRELGLEGIVSKHADRPHRDGRSQEWKKLKFRQEMDLVIGGYTRRKDDRHSIGALLVGFFGSRGELIYAGRVGSGFGQEQHEQLKRALEAIEQKQMPFASVQPKSESADASWVHPALVARVAYSNWTDEQRLRHATFLGLREDLLAVDVTRDSLDRESMDEKPATKRPVATEPPSIRTLSEDEMDSLSRISLSHPEKILFPDAQVTKLHLARYLAEVSPWLLPHVEQRPLSLLRCPDGVEAECFFQKHDHGTLPDAVHQRREAKDAVLYVSNLEGLVSLAQINAIELHVWNARVDRLESPDRLIWDLDPAPGIDWTHLVDAALRIRHRLHRLDLESFVKTSGKKGLHVVVPIERRRTWLEAKSFARGVAKEIAREAPDRLTVVSSQRARVGRIFIDYGRNGRGATTVAAYSPRARADAAVSVPVEWEELTRLGGAASLTMADLAEWLHHRSRDPWKSLLSTRQCLTNAAIREISQRTKG